MERRRVEVMKGKRLDEMRSCLAGELVEDLERSGGMMVRPEDAWACPFIVERCGVSFAVGVAFVWERMLAGSGHGTP